MQLGRRAFSIPALVTSFIACVLLLCCTIGTPTTFSTSTPFNVVQATNVIYKSNLSRRDTVDSTSINGFKLGNWGYCVRNNGDSGFKKCEKTSHGYSFLAGQGTNPTKDDKTSIYIAPGWTRGLVVVVVALVVAVIAFALSFAHNLIVMLIASLTHLLAFILTLIAFIIQIALYVHTKNVVDDVSDVASVLPGPAFYLTLISLPLLFFSALTVCCGWRRHKKSDASPAAYNYSSPEERASNFNNHSTTEPKTEDIPMKTSRQRVLDAFHNN